jgi:hypothetical protein
MQNVLPIPSAGAPISGKRQKGGQNETEPGIRCGSVLLTLRHKRLQLIVITGYFAVTLKRAIRQNLFSHLHLSFRPTPLSTDSSHSLFIASLLNYMYKYQHVTKSYPRQKIVVNSSNAMQRLQRQRFAISY